MNVSVYILLMALWLGIFYLVLILPNNKKKKKHQKMLDEVKINDTVLTIGGIKAQVVSIQDDYVELKVDSKGNRITIRKTAVSQVLN